MARMTTGSTLDKQGQPIAGTGFEFESDSRIAELLRQRISPLISQPITGEWVFSLAAASSTGGQSERGVGIFSPGNSGPPEHFHPGYDEHFEVVTGSFIFRIDGQERSVSAGEKVIVPRGVPHTFRCIGDQYGAAIAETRPAARIGEVISTLFAMAHEGKLTPDGKPKLMQAMVIGSEYADDTVFTSPPPAIALFVARLLAPIGRLLGYRPTYPQYREQSYWFARVQQPDI
jgi:quercetin dioxygenase-like cupin family protein